MPSATLTHPIDMEHRASSSDMSSFGTSIGVGGSLEEVNPCEAFEKRPAQRVNNNAVVVVTPSSANNHTNTSESCVTPVPDNGMGCDPQFPLLPGEFVDKYGGVGRNIRLFITNYRLFIDFQEKHSFYNIPLCSIDSAESKDLFALLIYCKDGKILRISCGNNEECKCWVEVINTVSSGKQQLDQFFAPCFRTWSEQEGRPTWLCTPPANVFNKLTLDKEFQRLQFDSQWRITDANIQYKLCETYPRRLIVPSALQDERLHSAARERFLKRLPVAVWRHKKQGSVLLRSSQPAGGFLGFYRCSQDEAYVKAIYTATNSVIENCSTAGEVCKPQKDAKPILILDARSYTSAWANRAKGGGYETVECYPECDIQFQGLANIHVVRNNFYQLRTLLSSDPDPNNYLQSLQNTNWLQNLSMLLSGAVRVMEALHDEGRSVLVHCSDGWDRTAQIVSLAKLMLDPYYRTFEGFRELVEREWVQFGHKFSDRCGLGQGNVNEISPVFLQWLDCVSQIHRQYTSAFQFNSLFLVKLAQHTYSGLFGTFLCNSQEEHERLCISSRTYSVWDLLNHQNDMFINWMYFREEHGTVIWPQCFIKDMVLWKELYTCGAEPVGGGISRPRSTSHISPVLVAGTSSMDRSFTRAHSYDSLTGLIPPDSPMINHHNELNNTNPMTITQLNAKSGSESDLARSPSLTSLGSVQSQVCGVLEKVVRRVSDEPDSITVKKLDATSVNNDRMLELAAGQCPFIDEERRGETSTPKIVLPLEGMATSTSDISDSIVSKANILKSDTAQVRYGPVAKLQDVMQQMMKMMKLSSDGGDSVGLVPRRKRVLVDWLDKDGLTKVDDVNNDRLNAKFKQIQRHCEQMKSDIAQSCIELQYRSNGHNMVPYGINALAARNSDLDDYASDLGGEARSLDSGGVSEGSWDCVEGEDGGPPTYWIPDHAVLNCMGCDLLFSVYRRKHHCRSCGKVFCDKCSSFLSEVPREQLNKPVRVCANCHATLTVTPSTTVTTNVNALPTELTNSPQNSRRPQKVSA